MTLTTSLADLDLLGEVACGGSCAALAREATTIRAFEVDVRVVKHTQLMRLKRAAGRPRDLEVVAELEALLEEVRGKPCETRVNARMGRMPERGRAAFVLRGCGAPSPPSARLIY